MLVLGIDTSCDDTAVAVVQDHTTVRANVISSQGIHLDYGGVVPELAARAHLTLLLPAMEAALQKAACRLEEMDAIAVTRGPGLVGCLLVGLSVAKSLALALRKPLIGVNHIEGHLFAGRLANPRLTPPFVALVVSGGHTQLVHVRAWGGYTILGRTRDDAAGEAFDKVAKLLGIGFPGGPLIDRLAEGGDPAFIDFPRTYLDPDGFEFSFSGIKTAVRTYLEGQPAEAVQRDLPHIAASFQAAVVDVLADKTIAAARKLGVSHILLTGGVACNRRLRAHLSDRGAPYRLTVTYPPPILCTDNGAMIAAAGAFHLSQGHIASLDLSADPRASLDTPAAGVTSTA
jgi:N6-L-threonylcarbamoyladenine synthase